MTNGWRAAIAALAVFILPDSATAQSTAPAPPNPAIGSIFDAATLRDLPLGDNIYALLETTQADVIADGFNAGGLNTGGGARLGGFLGAWSQTLFRIGEVNISDPEGSGSALIFPESMPWQHVRIDTGLMPADINTPGLAATLQPLRASNGWIRTLKGSASGGDLASGRPANQPPPIARLREYGHGSAVVGGPLSDRVGLVVAGAWAAARSWQRELEPSTRSALASAFAHLTVAAKTTREWRALGLIQRTERPFAQWLVFQDPAASTRDVSVHVQSTVEERFESGWRWRAFAGFTQRARTHQHDRRVGLVERISMGPAPAIVDDTADRTTRRLTGGARMAPPRDADSPHQLEIGVDLDSARTIARNQFSGNLRESLYDTPARIWTYTSLGESERGAITAGAYVNDRIALSPSATLDASVRAEVVHGSANGSAASVNAISLLPAIRLHWQFTERGRFAFVGGYARTAHALNLNWLAYGDPAAPLATVAAAARPAVVVSRVGPGTGGNPAFSRIDGNLQRPYSDEFVAGLESRPGSSTRLTLTGIARREGNLLAVVNSGLAASSYTTVDVPDEYIFLRNPEDDRLLTAYNRQPASFGADAYLLTNPELEAAEAYGLKLTVEHAAQRLFVLFGATAYLARGSAGNRGYGPRENDQDALGELLTNPNAATYPRGRLFSDRAFTIKWTTLYRMPYDITVGAIARYQDGQPFSRLVIVPDLNQGPEAVQAYPSGGTRFTFTGTLDLRLQKGFGIGSTRLEAIVDAYNLFTRSNEVEEYVVTGPDFRTPTAIQPPHAVHLGLRLTF
jgi:hypothetical protein